jgi:signal transduction histidine kinase
VRSAVGRFLLVGFVALVVVGTPAALWIRAQAEAHALSNVTLVTQRLADYALAPVVTAELLAGDTAALRTLDARLAPWLENGAVLRIKIWDGNGTIVYSDLPELIGDRSEFPQGGEALLVGGPGVSAIGTPDELENRHEPLPGGLVEVFVGSSAATGEPLIFEAYFNGDAVREQQTAVLIDMAPAFLLSLGVLQLAQLVPAVRLARRIQAGQVARRRLLQRAVDASALERRRIARDLHDEVIQDLAGLSYAMESEVTHGTSDPLPLFSRALAVLQQNVRTLRAMTTELYPLDLDRLGLPTALSRLTDPLRERGIEVKLSLPEDAGLSREQSAVLYRVAREVLANILKHADAHAVKLSLDQGRDGAVLRVCDDGRGFDPDAAAPDGHLGLRILRDTMLEAGGLLDIRSRPGEGTVVTARLRQGGPRAA